jgi:hypothetical protein
MTPYSAFLQAKAQDATFAGFAPVFMPSFLFDFQTAEFDWNMRKGKSGAFHDIISTEGQRGAKENMQRKSAQADRMFSLLVEHMHAALKIESGYKFTQEVSIPAWL